MQALTAKFSGLRRKIPLLLEKRISKQFVSIYLF
jgi:hypothetical protein